MEPQQHNEATQDQPSPGDHDSPDKPIVNGSLMKYAVTNSMSKGENLLVHQDPISATHETSSMVLDVNESDADKTTADLTVVDIQFDFHYFRYSGCKHKLGYFCKWWWANIRNDRWTIVRLAISAIFFLCSAYTAAFVSKLGFWRMPDEPPLPDAMHNAFPDMSDDIHIPDKLITFSVLSTVALIFLTYKRLAIGYRTLLIYGAIMFFRAACVILTTLPDSSRRCQGMKNPDNWAHHLHEIFYKAFMVIINAGNELTCGDMMFSGHTVILTICGMIWHKYFIRTRRAGYRPSVVMIVRLLVWSYLMFALYMIIATRLHYSIDVVIAFFVTVRTFEHYDRILYLLTKATPDELEHVWITERLEMLVLGWFEKEEIRKIKETEEHVFCHNNNNNQLSPAKSISV